MRVGKSTAVAVMMAGVCLDAACSTPVACVARRIAYRNRAIPALEHAGDRRDAPPLAERGNGVFVSAAYDPTGTLLITIPFFGSAPMHVWDAGSGALLASLQASVPGNSNSHIWMMDGARKRLFAQIANSRDYALFDLVTGTTISRLTPPPDVPPPFPVGLNAEGQALVFTPGFIELWTLDPPAVALRTPSVFTDGRYLPSCVGGVLSTYHEKRCWEWSPDRRTLALAYTPETRVGADTAYVLIDTATLDREPLERLSGVTRQTFTSFAFSPDNRWLAVGMHDAIRFFDRRARAWGQGAATVVHPRNDYLAPIQFSADSSRVIALGDQLQISVHAPESGMLFGRYPTVPGNFEGEIKASADGSRVVVYRFSSDTFEVLDGGTAGRLGWVCPYFCNMRHNPVQAPYAVSPDGGSVAISHRRGAAVWDTATDTIRFPLHDPKRKPLPYPDEP